MKQNNFSSIKRTHVCCYCHNRFRMHAVEYIATAPFLKPACFTMCPKRTTSKFKLCNCGLYKQKTSKNLYLSLSPTASNLSSYKLTIVAPLFQTTTILYIAHLPSKKKKRAPFDNRTVLQPSAPGPVHASHCSARSPPFKKRTALPTLHAELTSAVAPKLPHPRLCLCCTSSFT